MKNLVGQRFSRLVVLERAENDKHGGACWRCRCDCGCECIVRGANLRDGKTRSCGCLAQELRKQTHKTHGMARSKIYHAWQHLKDRCLNKGNVQYADYGGRGISVYEPWIDSFEEFYNYVSQLEHFGEDGYTLDRVNNGAGYEPGNLRWADAKTQSRNRRGRHLVEYAGEKMTLSAAAEKSGIRAGTLWDRIRRGWSAEKLFQPVKK